MIMVDARGKACPTPVMMTKEAVDKGEDEVQVLVDNPVSAGNVTRFLRSQGYEVSEGSSAEGIVISARRGQVGAVAKEHVPAADPVCVGPSMDMGILITSKALGSESQELGEALMKAFLETMRQSGRVAALALMNGGVLLALSESSTSETLREMEAQGTQVLVCGTCTKHFGITDQVTVGTISNMFEITERVFGQPKSVTIG